MLAFHTIYLGTRGSRPPAVPIRLSTFPSMWFYMQYFTQRDRLKHFENRDTTYFGLFWYMSSWLQPLPPFLGTIPKHGPKKPPMDARNAMGWRCTWKNVWINWSWNCANTWMIRCSPSNPGSRKTFRREMFWFWWARKNIKHMDYIVVSVYIYIYIIYIYIYVCFYAQHYLHI